jgi:hypothetical protein
MNYEKIYESLIQKGIDRQKNKKRKHLVAEFGPVEKHHIIPKCMGGTNESENLVYLIPEEHVMAHLLLVKIHPDNSKLWYAANWMTSRVVSNKEYGWVKRRAAAERSARFKGIPRTTESVEKQRVTVKKKYENGYVSPSLGTTLSPEHCKAISIGNTGKEIPLESRTNLDGYIMRYGDELGLEKYKEDNKKKDTCSLNYYISKFGEEIGEQKYNEMRAHRSEMNSGENNPFFNKNHTEETREHISKVTTGKPKYRSQEHNDRIGAAHRGVKEEIVTCPHCGKTGGGSVMKQWHFDNCKKNPSGPKKQRKVQPMVTCPHCGKTGNGPRMKSDHFDNCKLAP